MSDPNNNLSLGEIIGVTALGAFALGGILLYAYLDSKYSSNQEECCEQVQISEYMFPEAGRLKDGTRLGSYGARQFVIDDDNLPISQGFHEFILLENGNYMGKIGALRYLLDEDWDSISAGYHEITPTDIGYNSQLGSCYFTLSKEGEILNASSEDCEGFPEEI